MCPARVRGVGAAELGPRGRTGWAGSWQDQCRAGGRLKSAEGEPTELTRGRGIDGRDREDRIASVEYMVSHHTATK